MKRSLMALAALAGTPAAAQEQPAPPAPPASAVTASAPLRARIDGLVPLLNGGGDFDGFFGAAFRAQVPRAQFDAIGTQLRAALGRALAVASVTPVTPWSAQVQLRFEQGNVNAQIAVDPNLPHLVTGLRVSGAEASETSLEGVRAALAALPGRTALSVARLDAAGPQPVVAHAAATPLAIGSAFKLVILAELVRATNAGERRWSDTVRLDGRPLPGGRYTQRPAGTAVPLQELAEAMISVSDNSATDILLWHLGRTRVEAMLAPIGWRDGAAATRPFLATLEAFKIKGIGTLASRWRTTDEVGRRTLLAGEVAAMPASAIPSTLFQDGRPLGIETVEWFASADDLVRTLDWLRRNTEGPTGATARAILSKNPGIPGAAAGWAWVGYKGGSEPGVINMSFLLQARDGSWRSVVASWNDPAQAINDTRFMSLVARAVELAGR